MKKFIQQLAHPFYKRFHFWYHRKARKYTFKNVYTIVQPGVFSPKNTLSTKVFLDYISTLDITSKRVLELGCGSGIISVFAASQNAVVTASDINQIALDSLKKVSTAQNLKINPVFSDLLDEIEPTQFDYIFINPPYYPKNPSNLTEKAWFCGENFEFFEKLFFQLKQKKPAQTTVLMILSDACDIIKLDGIAKNNALKFNPVFSIELTFESNTIYQIQ